MDINMKKDTKFINKLNYDFITNIYINIQYKSSYSTNPSQHICFQQSNTWTWFTAHHDLTPTEILPTIRHTSCLGEFCSVWHILW